MTADNAIQRDGDGWPETRNVAPGPRGRLVRLRCLLVTPLSVVVVQVLQNAASCIAA